MILYEGEPFRRNGSPDLILQTERGPYSERAAQEKTRLKSGIFHRPIVFDLARPVQPERKIVRISFGIQIAFHVLRHVF